MEIVAGLGCVDDFNTFVKAGADELFVGYVPESYLIKYGMRMPLNRREVRFYNVQIGSESELRILIKMCRAKNIKLIIALNALSFLKEQIPDVLTIIERCKQMGVFRFIIADIHLLYAIQEKKELAEGLRLQMSGEFSELNASLIRYLKSLGVVRIIFPRQTTIPEMSAMIEKVPEMEYEAFVLNEKCHFTGAYCNSLHCDEFGHLCKVPYMLATSTERKEDEIKADFRNEEMEETLGESGCGLCNLYQYEQIGISHLKVVSRGNNTTRTRKDLEGLTKALRILRNKDAEVEYIREMKAMIFPNGCSRNCYGGIRDGMDG